MKKLFALLIVLLAAQLTQAQNPAPYVKMEIWEMASTADLAIVGKITQAQQGLPKITLEVQDVLVGEYTEKTIDIDKYINNKMGKRWAKYAEGEVVIIFLKTTEGKLKIMGTAGEGEKLVMGTDAYLDGRGNGVFNKFNYYPLPVTGQIYAEKLPLDEFTAAIKAYRKCFSVFYAEDRVIGFSDLQQVPFTKQLVDDKTLDDVRSVNDTAAKLVDMAYAKKRE